MKPVMLALALLALPAAAGCSKARDDGTSPTAEAKLPPLAIKDDTPDLMLTWIDEKGSTHVDIHPADVPQSSRALVRVVVADKEEGTRELFYVADLTKKKDDGSYGMTTMRRREWENEIEKRREALMPKPVALPAPQGSPGSGAPAAPQQDLGGMTAIVYGAEWCGPCHQAEKYLKGKGVRVVMKDIESTPGAAKEMREKLDTTGQRGGSIPVIDVQGQILVGFSPGAVDRALAKAGKGTVL